MLQNYCNTVNFSLIIWLEMTVRYYTHEYSSSTPPPGACYQLYYYLCLLVKLCSELMLVIEK